jgi:hypothetical protein
VRLFLAQDGDVGRLPLAAVRVRCLVGHLRSFRRGTGVLLGVDIDQDTDALVTHTNPHAGVLTTALAAVELNGAYRLRHLRAFRHAYFAVTPFGGGASMPVRRRDSRP